MSSAAPALLAAAAGVGFGHAVLPDHWMPLAVVGRVERYSPRRVARLASMAGVAHVVVSLVLGAIIIVIGLQFRSSVEHAQDAIVGTILILTALAFTGFELAGRGHRHGPGGHTHTHAPGGHTHSHGPTGHTHTHDSHEQGRDHNHAGHDHSHEHQPIAEGRRGILAVLIPFGAAASPDLTILPVFLAATAAGTLAAVGSLVIFAGVTIGTIVTLTVLAFLTGYRLEAQWLSRWGNMITAAVLMVIGILVAVGLL